MAREEKKGKPFLCSCGCLVGVIERNRRNVSKLVQYRQEDIYGIWIGHGFARCPGCGKLKEWHASQQWLDEYIKKRKRENDGEKI